jgi:glutamate racemase
VDNRSIAFLDSGIGSIPYARLFLSRNKKEKLILLADRENFPYGPKSKGELQEILVSLARKLKEEYDPKILVIACNTATISAIETLREAFPTLPIVGTVPAIKPAAQASKVRSIGVIGTERTIDEPYIMKLAAEFAPDCRIVKKASPSLVEFVERRGLKAGKGEVLSTLKPWVDYFVEEGADTLVLSCTHFLLLRDQFKTACSKISHPNSDNAYKGCKTDEGGCKDKISVFDSLEGVAKRIEFFLDEENLRAPPPDNGAPRPLLLVTGGKRQADFESAPYWEEISKRFGFTFKFFSV